MELVHKIRILIVDDHAVVRTGIRHILQRTPDIQVVGEAANGIEALQLAGSLSPQIMLLDIEMPVLNGIEVARQLRANGSPVRVLALSAYDDHFYMKELEKTGVSAYLTKDEAPHRLVEAVRKLARGEEGWTGRQPLPIPS